MKQMYWMCIAFAALYMACARPIPPTGGKKDETPPGLDSLRSTRNYQTRFAEKQFELVFDEWVTLQDVGTQVMVSPPLAKRPEVTLKGKTVRVEFDEAETLRANTTYTVNFGASVKDLHEGNSAKDLRFVFSTGDFIDSLRVEGVVTDAFSGEPVENISVMLYDDFSDSIVRKERPYYFSRTDKSGQFSIQNVRKGAFKCAAIDDVDQNLKWNGDSERIGFTDQSVMVGDSSSAAVALRLFKNAPDRQRLLDKTANRYGFIRLRYALPLEDTAMRSTIPLLRRVVEQRRDTLNIWYDRADTLATNWQLLIGPDTVVVKAPARPAFIRTHRFGLEGEALPASETRRGRGTTTEPAKTTATSQPPRLVSVLSGGATGFTFNMPVARFDTAFWKFTADSLRYRAFSVQIDSVSSRRLNLTGVKWASAKNWQLMLLPGAVTDLYGIGNADTLRFTYSIVSEKQLGGLNLDLEGLIAGKAYVLQLLNGESVMLERPFTAAKPKRRFEFRQLQTGTYAVRIIEDLNRNGYWDTGNYFARQQPERLFLKKLEPMRANWEMESVFNLEPEKNSRSRN